MVSRKRDRGFTLIEILIVMALIAVLVAIAVPQLVKSKSAGNEKAVVSTLRGVVNGQGLRLSEKGQFGTLQELGSENYVEIGATQTPATNQLNATVNFDKAGYRWEAMTPTSRQSWTIRCRPIEFDKTGRNCFFVNETGVVRQAEGNPSNAFTASVTSPPLQ